MRSRLLGGVFALSLAAPSLSVVAQDTTVAAVQTLPARWRPRFEGTVLLGTLAGALAISSFDAPIGTEMRAHDFRNGTAVGRTAHFVNGLGSPGAVLISAGVFAAGKLAGRPGFEDAGWHATQSVLLAGGVTSALKFAVGRARPLDVEGSDGDEFSPFRGHREEWSSMPSGHTTVAFAAASAFSAELGRSHPKAARWVRPLLYAGAAAVGISRVVDERHWASDVIVGAGVGTFVGRRLVGFSHRARTPR
ncbi:MAG: phosphatase PAP2 family protein [Cytophagaceae bacterium]|nr:phosphatase PAP2 family protein [Gemmatimonadaceae bacterium]